MDWVGMANPSFPVDNGMERIFQSLSEITSRLGALEKAGTSGGNIDNEKSLNAAKADCFDSVSLHPGADVLFGASSDCLYSGEADMEDDGNSVRDKQNSESLDYSDTLASVYNLLGVAKPPVASVEPRSQMQQVLLGEETKEAEDKYD